MTIRELKGYRRPLVASVAMLAIFSAPCASFAQEQSAPPSTSTPDSSQPTPAAGNTQQTTPDAAQPATTPDSAQPATMPDSAQPATTPESAQPSAPAANSQKTAAPDSGQQTAAPDNMGAGQNKAPDNSRENAAQQKTAQQQPENTSDRMMTKKIRKSIMADKSLSMYAHNVKVISQNGAVTLKGPVKSEDEKQAIGAKAAEVVGSPDKVMNQLTVKQ